MEDFYKSLNMQAQISPFDSINLPRIVQLIGKTNQFNLTTRRHNTQVVQAFIDNSDCVHLYLRLKDQFTDHGLVSVLIAVRQQDVLEIDTWLMSCRVIGRTVENAMLNALTKKAKELNCTTIKGVYIRTEKNLPVKNIFADFGFKEEKESTTGQIWLYDLQKNGIIESNFIKTSGE
jgi:FkbH-like protein